MWIFENKNENKNKNKNKNKIPIKISNEVLFFHSIIAYKIE